MKNLVKFLIVVLLLALLYLTSCTNPEPLNNYKGARIVGKYSGEYLKLLIGKRQLGYDSTYTFKDIKVLKYDYDRVKIGDVIK